jgi:hypothetical protein
LSPKNAMPRRVSTSLTEEIVMTTLDIRKKISTPKVRSPTAQGHNIAPRDAPLPYPRLSMRQINHDCSYRSQRLNIRQTHG